MPLFSKVIAGDYEGKTISTTSNITTIDIGIFKTVELNGDTIESMEVVEENDFDAVSGVLRGAVGLTLFGTAGLLAGLSARKGTRTVIIEFKDGKRSLVQLKDKDYQNIYKNCF